MDTLKETKESKKLDIKGRWLLHYKTINTLGNDAFGGTTLTAYKHPRTFKKVPRLDPNGYELPYLIIGTIDTVFDPDNNIQHKLDIEWMLHHPEIKVEGYDDLPEIYKKAKRSNAQLTLKSLDNQMMTEIVEQDYIDNLIARLTLDGGPKAIGIDKLRFILAELNLAYRYDKYHDKKDVEKKILKNKLKNYIRDSYEKAKKVGEIINNFEAAKINYYVKEMIRTGVIVETGGMYKYNGIPLGVSVAGILQAWEREPELKATMIRELD